MNRNIIFERLITKAGLYDKNILNSLTMKYNLLKRQTKRKETSILFKDLNCIVINSVLSKSKLQNQILFTGGSKSD